MNINRNLTLTLLAFAGMLVMGSASARDYYGALVYNSRSGVTAYAVNAYSSYEAERRARRQCRQRHGYNDSRRFACRVVVRFRNTCAAYATSRQYDYGRYIYGWGYAPRSPWARRRAVRNCYDKGGRYCSVRVWACTTRVPYRRY